MRFEPIAIVARACVLPGALDPETLFRNILDKKSSVTPAPENLWRVKIGEVLKLGEKLPDHAFSDVGGHVRGFENIFDPNGFAKEAALVSKLDPIFQWVLHCGRICMDATNKNRADIAGATGLVLGNLGFPSRAMAQYAEDFYWQRESEIHPFHRFNCGMPALFAEEALSLGRGAYSLDSACASSLYAIKLACDRLHDRSADFMLAGAVNRADDLFLHVGFSALDALSRTGQTRPFHKGADGLLPAEGAALVMLERLDDARANGHEILGVIRGVGLSNDGRGRGILVPSEDGQERAIRSAYEMAGIDPRDVGLLECHATGTPIGDATELRSTARVFKDAKNIPIGSLKSNLGHLITSAGVAGLLKVLGALETSTRPPQLHVDDARDRIDAFAQTPFRVLTESERWDGPKRAGISAFGFGGNNAHLVVESIEETKVASKKTTVKAPSAIAITSLGARFATGESAYDFARALFSSERFDAARNEIAVSLDGLKFPPNDLGDTLSQQLVVLEAAREAAASLRSSPDRTMTIIGMECDPEITRYGARWRAHETVEKNAPRQVVANGSLETLKDAFIKSLTSAGVVGTMPNIPANRISSQLDFRGPSFTVSAEEASGLVAIELGARALRAGDADAVVVGAVDMSCEAVHAAALRALGVEKPSSDGAFVMVLERAEDARAAGRKILAIVEESAIKQGAKSKSRVFGNSDDAENITQRLGSPHAAEGMLHAAAAALALHHRATPSAAEPADASLPLERIDIHVKPLLGAQKSLTLKAADHAPFVSVSLPRLHIVRGADRAEVVSKLDAKAFGDDAGKSTLVIVAATDVERDRKSEQARTWLLRGGPMPEGVSYRDEPLRGDLACVFTGAGAAYSGMGRDLFLASPQLFDSISDRMKRDPAPFIVWPNGVAEHPMDQLWGAAVLTQTHAQITLRELGLKPQAAIGYSSGESNALFALRAWTDLEQMIVDGAKDSLFYGDLCAPWTAAQRYAKRVGGTFTSWKTFSVAATAEEIRAALVNEPMAFLSIINAPGDCVLAGDDAACARVIEKLGGHRVMPLGYDMVAHCPVIEEERQGWWELHHRAVAPIDGVRFYSNGLTKAFVPTRDLAAEGITNQALATLDFPATVERAYKDGVRIFVEHGPRNRVAAWIKSILGDREHVAVSLDVAGRPSLHAIANAVAGLVAAGVDIDLERFFGPLRAFTEPMPHTESKRSFPAHPPAVILPALHERTATQPAAPRLASVYGDNAAQFATPSTTQQHVATHTYAQPSFASDDGYAHADVEVMPREATVFDVHAAFMRNLAIVHEEHLQHQAFAHTQFLESRAAATNALLEAYATVASATFDGNAIAELPAVEYATDIVQVVARQHAEVAPHTVVETPARVYPGPKFSRKDLEHLSSSTISTLFGPQFAAQDQYARQVRMPEPPLLLADRVLGIDAEPAVLGVGTLWTETDVRADSWYLDAYGRMPAGIMIESGQADLLLISWMGADLLNKGERVYRLLGCDLTYHGPLPEIGETLHYEIHIDGHANQGDVRLFFFHYDCYVNGVRRLSVRGGQAGFFTTEELANSAGILWDPMSDMPNADEPLALTARATDKKSLSREDLENFAKGDLFACFGPNFSLAQSHVRSPRIGGKEALFLHRVTTIDPHGGPWQRGYLRAEADISPDDWFFRGHFKNDPCMPGTLMFEGCVQALSVYLAALGFTTERDAYRFEPVYDEKLAMRCRGQVTPESKNLIYEVFVSSVQDGDTPTVTADLLCTVDGRKAFHARRVSLRLIPDWPLPQWEKVGPATQYQSGEPLTALTLPKLAGLVGYKETGPVAVVDGFRFDYRSLLACAWGTPSEAFGPFYEGFDNARRVARLPGPPYHFMSRIQNVEGKIGSLEPGLAVEVVYDIPESVWYFDENGHRTMPFCVLMEAALQPCGWLASYSGGAFTSDVDLLFRNLDGTGTLIEELLPTSGPMITRAKLTNVSVSGGMCITSFEVECLLGDRVVYKMDTVFGFFPKEAFRDQAGLPVNAEHRERIALPSNVNIDLTTRILEDTKGPRLAHPMLCMIDRVRGFWPEAGPKNLGYLRAEKDIDPAEWFFKAHFFQDPVQPGSLGVEALLQLIQFFMIEKGMTARFHHAHFEPVMLGKPAKWKYRGQVTPENKKLTSEAEIIEIGEDEHGPFVIANAWLWVDGKRIYSVHNLGMRVREHDPKFTSKKKSGDSRDEVLDPNVDKWLADHCPTYVIPAVPMMSIADRLVKAAQNATGKTAIELSEVQVSRWLVAENAIQLRTQIDVVDHDRVRATLLVFREAKTAELSRFEPVASGVVRVGERAEKAPAALPVLANAKAVPDPYEEAALFHGPAFHYLTDLKIGAEGATATLDAARGTVPRGTLHQGLLDALTHAIPHTELSRWSKEIGSDVVAYPHRIDWMRFYEPLPESGSVRVEARFKGLDESKRFPRTEVQAIVDGRVALAFSLTEILVPKGPVGSAPGRERRAFLAGNKAENVSLSTFKSDTTTLRREDIYASDWFPGTLVSVYGATSPTAQNLAEQIAVQEHVAHKYGEHPAWAGSDIQHAEFLALTDGSKRAVVHAGYSTHPFLRHEVEVISNDQEVRVRDIRAPRFDLEFVKHTWRKLTGISLWPMEDLYASLIQCFVSDVVFENQAAFDAVTSGPCLFVANHQVGVESVLASVLLTAVSNLPTAVLAKSDHRESWIGRFITLNSQYPGVRDPELTLFVDRDDPNAMLTQFAAITEGLRSGKRSAMVHIEGTRSLSCRTPTTKLSSMLLDVAIAANVPVVPVRFVGGLPVEPLEKRIEFPLHYGAQKYHVGAPMMPAVLSKIPLRERVDTVLRGLNATGVSPADEQPCAPNPELEKEILAWQKKSGASLTDAVCLVAMSHLTNPSDATQRILDARAKQKLVTGNSAEDKWLSAFSEGLFGPR